MAEKRILIVDDDPEITSALARGLTLHGYEPETSNRVDTALETLRTGGLAAAIVDVMIGNDSGLDLVRQIRDEGGTTPILMLSALTEVEDRARGLEAGADDYVVKPFSFDELIARVKVQEQRARVSRPRARLDPAHWSLTSGTRSVALTQREFSLLRTLAEHPGEALSRYTLFERLWAGEGASSENVVDVYVGYLRRKLDPATDFGFEIKTIRNRGFQLDGTPPDIC
ncbi:DNA-binding response regulator, OmpR family, contains REC and winged-helix (wHTH) domain [Poseidonocella pacifica]|uniref:DNA-binding response regulator, OmpR family, contains REC and winged-helix (WHTH) domain n=1 Tax=Poseidonocella pacifica TaxID=871651 RepID=A0A1I0YIY9_9RHOB|nr:response regulator transcription factor [Poseidonocella pacifica]SFB12103.1 DNA-binding response regulator, OmpR family, contains REC and winged-helix (wHTH) domain [Poseidonocella pacifica]